MASGRFDPQLTLAAFRRRVANAPVQVADGFARLVESSSEPRLEQLMRSPARRAILEGIFWQMPQHLDRSRASGVNGTLAWEVTGRPDGASDTYLLTISDGRARVRRGAPDATPSATITVSGPDFLRLVTGALDPMQAYFSSRIKLSGDLMLAAQLQSLFRIPHARRAPDAP